MRPDNDVIENGVNYVSEHGLFVAGVMLVGAFLGVLVATAFGRLSVWAWRRLT
jgi:hypothetical protein